MTNVTSRRSVINSSFSSDDDKSVKVALQSVRGVLRVMFERITHFHQCQKYLCSSVGVRSYSSIHSSDFLEI